VFGKRDDPTANWPQSGAAPTLDLAGRSVGPLRLGDPIDRAKALGRPARVRGVIAGGDVTLEYPSFQLEFSGGRLICVKFDVDDDSSPVQVGLIRLSRATRPPGVRVSFGEPSSDSAGAGGLRWIDYERDGATLALEFTGEALSCVQLYAEGYA